MRELLTLFDVTGYSPNPDGVILKDFLDLHLRAVSKNKIRLGDVLLFRIFEQPQHVGIATDHPCGALSLIHFYSGSRAVVEHILSPAWQRMLVGGYRFRSRGKK